jgi:hypothetical protein
MPETALNPSAILRKEYQDTLLEELTGPKLIFEDMFPHVDAEAQTVTYFADKYTSYTHPDKAFPAPRTSEGQFATVKIQTRLDRKYATLLGFGMSIEYGPDVRRYPKTIDEIARGRDLFAAWLAEYVNNKTAADITNDWAVGATSVNADAGLAALYPSGTSSGVGYEKVRGFFEINQDGAYAWDLTASDPIKDILRMKLAFAKQSNSDGARYPYQLTDLFLDTEEHTYLAERLVNKTQTLWQQSPFVPGVQVPVIFGVSLHPVDFAFLNSTGSVQSSKALGFDRGAKPATIYESFDPQFGRAGPFNTHQYTRDEDHVTVYQAWSERVTALKTPKAFLLVNGI